MSPEEKAKADEIYKAIIGKERNTLVDRYGKDAEKVAKGRAVKQAQKLAEKKMDPIKDKLREMVKGALIGTNEELKGGQKKLDVNKDNEISGDDFAMLRKGKLKEYDPDQDQLDDEDEIPMSYDDDGLPLGLGEDLDLGHEDNEPHMIKGELYRIGKYAMELYQMVDQFEGKGEVDFPAWWQAKITTAKNMVSSAKHYLEFELREPEIDAMVGAVDTISMNEAKNKEEDILGDLIIDMLKYKSYDEVKQTLARTLRDALAGEENVNKAKPEIDAIVGVATAEDIIPNVSTEPLEEAQREVMIDGKLVDISSIEVSNVYPDDYPDFSDAYAANAQFMDGTELTDEQLSMLDDKYSYLIRNAAEDYLTEKKLTKPELKKREEIAKAMEKGDPKMDMEKKMAIATSIAKKVAERLMAKK
jgi:hypothetical protein